MSAWQPAHPSYVCLSPASRTPPSAKSSPSEYTPLRSILHPTTGRKLPSGRLKLCLAGFVALSLGLVFGYMSMTILDDPPKASSSESSMPLLLVVTDGGPLDRRNNLTTMLAQTYARRADVVQVDLLRDVHWSREAAARRPPALVLALASVQVAVQDDDDASLDDALVSLDTYTANVHEIVSNVRAIVPSTTRIVLVTPPPMDKKPANSSNPGQPYAEACVAAAATLQVSVLDPWHTLDGTVTQPPPATHHTNDQAEDDAARVIHDHFLQHVQQHAPALSPNALPYLRPKTLEK
ncbi:Aste57867_16549 [Aphanomyces stellatus]|uniref:Aste57867_16549 protein n=1 Tax=Aphanomyces stellatus TaxID=120398 RepID=A0A485L7A1_9STRA|nr:hypothetical protein As57867_016492 [Aphanomyces stellatus]VFT93323.1 Aste57867_16549 [Aphanomyces stellatus]